MTLPYFPPVVPSLKNRHVPNDAHFRPATAVCLSVLSTPRCLGAAWTNILLFLWPGWLQCCRDTFVQVCLSVLLHKQPLHMLRLERELDCELSLQLRAANHAELLRESDYYLWATNSHTIGKLGSSFSALFLFSWSCRLWHWLTLITVLQLPPHQRHTPCVCAASASAWWVYCASLCSCWYER